VETLKQIIMINIENLTEETVFDFINQYSKSEIKKIINDLNITYRTSDAKVSDKIYDLIYDTFIELYPDEEKIGYELDENDERKRKLPIIMPSMNKVKSYLLLLKWAKSKGIKLSTEIIITPKYDGLSILQDHYKLRAYTRGDALFGRLSTEHIKKIDGEIKPYNFYTVGECVISKKNFAIYQQEEVEKGNDKPSNSRNSVSGFLIDDDAKDRLKYADYIRFGVITEEGLDKNVQLDKANQLNKVKIPYKLFKLSEITEELLNDLFNLWSEDYDIDGLIIEVNDKEIRKRLGAETNDNPAYARAYKADFEKPEKTKINKIKRNVNRFGKISYVSGIDQVIIGGAEITNATLNNASHTNNYKLFVGEEIEIIRSGEVIPKIIKINGHKIPFKYMFETIKEYNQAKKELIAIRKQECQKELDMTCPSCGSELKWNETKIDLICHNDNCEQKQFNKVVAFFDHIGVEEVGEPTIQLFFDNGYNTIKSIIEVKQDTIETFDRVGERKAEIIYTNIHSKLQDIKLEKLQHASSCFKILGSKQIKLINNFLKSGDIDDILTIKGVGNKLAQDYVDNINAYKEFEESIKEFINIKQEDDMINEKNSNFANMVVVFTKVRDKDLEEVIKSGGGRVTGSVSKNTTHLVIKEKGGAKISGKEQKAMDLGLPIYTLDEFKTEFL